MSDYSTTSSRFPVIDITHKPKRLQRDNIIQAGTMSEYSETPSNESESVSDVPLHNVTIERAIEYYERHTDGELSTLYRNTALWLRQLLSVGMNAVHKAEKHKSAESEVANEIQKSD